MNNSSLRAMVDVLRPILERVRLDVTAVKGDGMSYWTDEPMTEGRLREHLMGGQLRGVCPIKAGESVTRLALLDLDSHQGQTSWDEMLATAARVADALAGDGMHATAFRSSGGRGMHLYVIWDAPQDAYSVREALSASIARAGFKSGTKGVALREIEIFPKQNNVPVGGNGNQFILPMGGKSEPLDLTFGESVGCESVVWAASQPVAVRESPVKEQGAEGSTSLATLRSALSRIPNNGRHDGPDYDQWRDIVFGVHSATGGSEDGFKLALEYSLQNKDIVAEKGEDGVERFLRDRVWNYVRVGGGVTAKTIFKKAGESGWRAAPELDFQDVETGEPVNLDWQIAGSYRQPQVASIDDLFAEVPVSGGGVAPVLGASVVGLGAVGLLPTAPPVDVMQISHEARVEWKDRIANAATELNLKHDVCPAIVADVRLKVHGDRNALAEEVRQQLAKFGTKVSLAVCKGMVTPRSVPTVLQKRRMTEFGNAERMLDTYHESLMYVPETDSWYIWDGMYWKRSRGANIELEHLCKLTVLALANEVGDYDDPTEFYQFCATSQRAYMVENMIKLARSDERVVVSAEELDKHPHYLGVANGVVDLRTGELLPPDPDMYITLNTGVKYDPTAKCPVFEQTIKDVFCDDMEMVEYTMRTFGYALMGAPIEDIMFFPFGDGSNGKSTIFGTIRSVFGSYARAAEASSFVSDDAKGGSAGGAREDLVRLRGARFVYVNEPDEGSELREGMIKSMTGGDAINARAMYAKSSIEIRPTWVAYMPTNHRPIIKGSDNGIWRRMGMIPFERNFEKDPTIVKDEGREAKLKSELVGVLTAVVRSCLMYQKKGLAPPQKVLASRDSYRDQMDLLAEWLDECCELSPDARCEMRVLWESWESFARQRGLLNYIRSSSALGRRLDKRFVQVRGPTGSRMRAGIKVKTFDLLFQ